MCTRKAYTLIETLLVLLVLPIVLTLIFSTMKLVYRYDYGFIERQNLIGIIQLRKRVALGSDITLKNDRLIMIYNNREIQLYCSDDKLIEQYGYMEYLIGLNNCAWEFKSGLIYINFDEDTKKRRVFIGYES